ncbi:MAG: hypothetical protein ACT6QN_01485, partial [Aeromicrobium sp.]|uniref:hypothetical protein n=1 Tax=Aeromicrobium sp. TaxID=1871063 RepID=UPI004037FCC5
MLKRFLSVLALVAGTALMPAPALAADDPDTSVQAPSDQPDEAAKPSNPGGGGGNPGGGNPGGGGDNPGGGGNPGGGNGGSGGVPVGSGGGGNGG